MLNERAIEFPSEGTTLKGLLITPGEADGRLPAVILAHGTSATFRMVAIEYAREFARHGFAALIYDHRNFGISGGEPRGEINPWVQSRGYRDALSFAETLGEVASERLALWGDSYTGGQVIVVGACDARVTAVVAQCPVFGAAIPAVPVSDQAFAQIRSTLQSGDVTGTPETTTGPLPVVSADQTGTPSFLAPIQAFRWFIDYGGRPGSLWVNRVTRVLPPTPVPYSPFLCAPYLRAKTLLMVAPEDEMVHANYDVARRAFDSIPGEKEWYEIADGHFGLIYHPGERFDEACAEQVRFLKTALLS